MSGPEQLNLALGPEEEPGEPGRPDKEEMLALRTQAQKVVEAGHPELVVEAMKVETHPSTGIVTGVILMGEAEERSANTPARFFRAIPAGMDGKDGWRVEEIHPKNPFRLLAERSRE